MAMIALDLIKSGYNLMVGAENEPSMLMEIGLIKLDAGESFTHYNETNEAALLLLDGTIDFRWEEKSITCERKSVFDEKASLLHVSRGTEVTIQAVTAAELLLQKTENSSHFPSTLYMPADIGEAIFCEGLWGNTANRYVRKIFDFSNAPYSNMVMGETINLPGKWSSYIPHSHPQPEVYYYRFDRQYGFGAGFVDDTPYKLEHNTALCIPGGATHPQTSAPGYAMYFCWMIRHLPDAPWTTRIDDHRYRWLLEKDVKIWPDK